MGWAAVAGLVISAYSAHEQSRQAKKAQQAMQLPAQPQIEKAATASYFRKRNQNGTSEAGDTLLTSNPLSQQASNLPGVNALLGR